MYRIRLECAHCLLLPVKFLLPLQVEGISQEFIFFLVAITSLSTTETDSAHLKTLGDTYNVVPWPGPGHARGPVTEWERHPGSAVPGKTSQALRTQCRSDQE